MQTKTCSKCNIVKTVNNFNYRNKAKNQYQSQCNSCKHAKSNICKCGEPIHNKSKTCRRCKISKEQSKADNFTLGDKRYDKLASSRYGYIRYRARMMGKVLDFKSCRNCGYDKHFEVCHIKSVSDFTDSTLISEINNPDNLIPLCPNCHWEFDNGKLQVSSIV